MSATGVPSSDPADVIRSLRNRLSVVEGRLSSVQTGEPNRARQVRFVTAEALPAYTVSADKMTLTANANGAITILGTASPDVGDTILVRAEGGVLSPNNGIYVVIQKGDAATPWIITRAGDADSVDELPEGALVGVRSGPGGQRLYRLTWVADGPWTLGVSQLAFIQVEGYSVPTRPNVSLLGTGLLDRDEIVVEVETGVHWRFRWHAASGYWQFIGGPPIQRIADASRSITNQTAYVATPTDPIQFSIPLAGDFDIELEGNVWLATGGGFNTAYLSYALSFAAASDTWCVSMGIAAAAASLRRTRRHVSLPLNTTVAERVRTSGNFTATFAYRRIAVTPVRCLPS